jgi:ABC-type branched-subunit amino acid transport system substrate-binding protein
VPRSRAARAALVLILGLALGAFAARGSAAATSASAKAPAASSAVQAPAPAVKSRDASYGNTPPELQPFRDFGKPYRDLFPEPLPFPGPGRDAPEPKGLTEVRIGVLAPGAGSPDEVAGRSMKRGATLALEEANAAGGYKGLPFRFMLHDDLPVWGASSNEIVKMAYEEHVWAALGSVSGDSSHIAIRVALKAFLPVMNTATADPTFTETAIPWAFRCIADARQQSYALAREIFETEGYQRLAVMRSNDRYGRMGIVELREAALRLGHPLVSEVNWLATQDASPEDFTHLVERTLTAKPDALVVWGPPEAAGRALVRARQMGLTVPAFGPARLVSDRFWVGFRERYRARWGEEPDAYAAHGYDGMNLVIAAVRKAGLNRVRIRDALAAVERYHGVTGEIVFDNTFNDVGKVPLARVESGEFHYGSGPGSGAARRAAGKAEPAGTAEPAAPLTVGLLVSEKGELAGLGRGVARGAGLAAEESHRQVRLVTASVRDPWASVGEAARDLLERDGAAGLVTALDRAGSHLAAQVATKLRRPLVAANDASPLLHATGVPWIALPVPGAEAPAGFAERFEQRYGTPPDAAARAGYLATRRLLEALASGRGRAAACALNRSNRDSTQGSTTCSSS